MQAYEKVSLARAAGRPTALAYIHGVFDDFFELHGDRFFGDDPALVCGIAELNGLSVTVIGLEKGGSTQEKISRNFGSANPEGYRKALRAMKQAEKFHRPVVCLVDTAGAYCGIGAEERGQGSAIAANLVAMMGLKTPVISIMIGEGGSGGAIALAAANEVWILENAYYAVISPEGAASIIWKDAGKVKEACEALQLTAADLARLGIVERVFAEKGDVFAALREALGQALPGYLALPAEKLTEQRYEKFRKVGRSEL
ncbi:MAG: carboxyltransferase subunit alpha [Eubacteriales bacterium]|nr:carboxyltransferase subunit alpha [Eubacteriales bacterium]